jgi:hypothetical protein
VLFTLPLLAVQLLWLNLVTNGILDVALDVIINSFLLSWMEDPK